MERHDTHAISATISSEDNHSYTPKKQNQNNNQKNDKKTGNVKKIQIDSKGQIDEKHLKNIKSILDKYKLTPKTKETDNTFKQKSMSQKNIFYSNKITEILNLQKFQRGEFVDSTNSDEERLVISNKELKTVKNNLKTNDPNINKNLKNNSTSNINSSTYPLLFGCSYKSTLNQTKYNNVIQYEKKLSDINNQKNNEKLLYFKSNFETGKNFFYANITKPHRSFMTKLFIGKTVNENFYENSKINENNENKENENNSRPSKIYIPILFSVISDPYLTTKQIVYKNQNNYEDENDNVNDNENRTSKIIKKFNSDQSKKTIPRRNSVQSKHSAKVILQKDYFFKKEFHYDREHNFDVESFSDINDSSSSENYDDKIKKYKPIKPKKKGDRKKTIKRKTIYQNNAKKNVGSLNINKKGIKKKVSQSSKSKVSNESEKKNVKIRSCRKSIHLNNNNTKSKPASKRSSFKNLANLKRNSAISKNIRRFGNEKINKVYSLPKFDEKKAVNKNNNYNNLNNDDKNNNDNNKFDNSFDSCKQTDFKHFIEEERTKRNKQIIEYLRRKKINSYNLMFPHEPSPLLGMFRKNYELYGSIVNNEEKNNNNIDKNIKKIEKNKINDEDDKMNINIRHKIEKHYGNQKDCPICLSLMEKIEGKENISETSKRKSAYRRRFVQSGKIFYHGGVKVRGNNFYNFNLFLCGRNNSVKNNGNNIDETTSLRQNEDYSTLYNYFQY